MNGSRRRLTIALAGLVMATVAVIAAPAGAGALTRAGSCGITWGSLPKTGTGAGDVTSIRAGQHDCYDRVVFDGQRGFNEVRYVSQVTTDGAGTPVPLLGGAFLQVSMRTPSTSPLFHGPFPDARGFQTLRQVAGAGGFEGYESFGIGVRARLPFRVFTVDAQGSNPRLVVDIAHRW
ncbi:MAG: hypothetical protein QOF30_3688 [Acidimicrobiaceae bacterium]|jgi:hypothetical protein|nr:hypothetical protein [Acidimicrobiaceae bacterium]